jgi:hypothetical protein
MLMSFALEMDLPRHIGLIHLTFGPALAFALATCIVAGRHIATAFSIYLSDARWAFVQVPTSGLAITRALATLLVVESGAEFLHLAGGERAWYPIERKGTDGAEERGNRCRYYFEDCG